MNLKIVQLKANVYKKVLTVIVGSPRKVAKYLNKTHKIKLAYEIEPCDGRLIELSIRGHIWFVIYLRQFTGTNRDYATLCHECGHAALYMLQNAGVKDFDEALFYLQEQMVVEISKKLKR